MAQERPGDSLKPLRKLDRLTEALERGEVSLEEGKPLQRARKRQEVLLELMEEALDTDDAGDFLELLEFTRKYGTKIRRDLKREMMSNSYYPAPAVLDRLKRREAAEIARQAAEDAKGLLDRDTKRIESIGPMLPFLKPGRIQHDRGGEPKG
jgi:hypothetical protein